MQRITVTLEDSWADRLRVSAALRRVSVSELAAALIGRGLDEGEPHGGPDLIGSAVGASSREDVAPSPSSSFRPDPKPGGRR